MVTQQWRLLPFEAAGPVRLGTTRDEVRSQIGGEVEQFRKSPDSEAKSDYFLQPAIIAHYDPADRLEALEFAGDVVPTWNGIMLMGRSLKAVYDDVTPYSADAEVDDDGVTFHDLGFGLYAPGWREDGSEMTEAVIVFRRSYYSRSAEKTL